MACNNVERGEGGFDRQISGAKPRDNSRRCETGFTNCKAKKSKVAGRVRGWLNGKKLVGVQVGHRGGEREVVGLEKVVCGRNGGC